VGSNPAEDVGFLRAIKILSMTSSGGEVKPSVPCHKFVQHAVEPYYKYEKRYLVGKINGHFL
jgi:hypothetical protein